MRRRNVSAFDPLDMGRRLVAMRRRRLARDEDEQNALFAARASQEFWNAARLSADAPASTPAATSNAPRALPFVGPGAPAPADRSSLAEEEWNFSRPGNASGGAGKAAAGRERGPCPLEKRAASSSPGGGAAVLRSPGATKAGLATGSQAAVVKLASYGAGSVRAGALHELSEPQGRAGAGAGRRNPGFWETGRRRSRGAMARRGGWAGAVERRAVLYPHASRSGDSRACSGRTWRRAKGSRLRVANGRRPKFMW